MEKWFRGVDPERRKELLTRKILDLIPQIGDISWSALLEKAKVLGIGRATLSRHLKRLVKLNILERRVDISTYPPRVYYKRRSLDEPKFYMPYEAATGLFPQPTKDSSADEVERWILAQTRLFLANMVFTLAPPPMVFRNMPEKDVEKRIQEIFHKNSQNIQNQIGQLHLLFSKLTVFNAEKLHRVTESLVIEHDKLFESAIKLYNLTVDKIVKGEAPLYKQLFPLKLPLKQGNLQS
jgi:DNA-binding transcriptional ArsR family regulator